MLPLTKSIAKNVVCVVGAVVTFSITTAINSLNCKKTPQTHYQ